MPDSNAQSLTGADGAVATPLVARPAAAPEFRAEPDAVERAQPAATRYRRRVLLVLAGLVLAVLLYWGSSYIFAYTDDAYVTSDLVGVAPLQEAEHLLRAAMPDERTRKLLAMKRDEPCLVVIRRTWTRGQIASVARLYYPGSRYEMSGRFRP